MHMRAVEHTIHRGLCTHHAAWVNHTENRCWYHKAHPTFADALAMVRKELWASATFYGSPAQSDTIKVPRAFVERLTDTLCYAA